MPKAQRRNPATTPRPGTSHFSLHDLAPFLILTDDGQAPDSAKTADALVRLRPELCSAFLDTGRQGPDRTLDTLDAETGKARGARSVVIGLAPAGDQGLPAAYEKALRDAAAQGLHVISGLHRPLVAIPGLASAAAAGGARLIDLRHDHGLLQVGDGAARRGQRILTVGTDCAVGKMLTAWRLTEALDAAGKDATFRATGQTGILLSGAGVPLDALPGDFLSGAIEQLAPAAADTHWDVIEGQGSVFHPSFAGISLALLHGAQAQHLVLCHAIDRKTQRHAPDYAPPELDACMALHLELARRTQPAVRFAGISLNTRSLGQGAEADAEAEALCAATESKLGLPVVDPIRHGVSRLVQALDA